MKHADRIEAALGNNPRATEKELARMIGRSTRQVRRIRRYLREEGRVQRVLHTRVDGSVEELWIVGAGETV